MMLEIKLDRAFIFLKLHQQTFIPLVKSSDFKHQTQRYLSELFTLIQAKTLFLQKKNDRADHCFICFKSR